MKFLRVYNFFTGEPLADIWPDEGDSVSVVYRRPLHKDVDWRERHRYARMEFVEQKMLTAKPVWLEPT